MTSKGNQLNSLTNKEVIQQKFAPSGPFAGR
jgi:hypothetical protein